MPGKSKLTLGELAGSSNPVFFSEGDLHFGIVDAHDRAKNSMIILKKLAKIHYRYVCVRF